VHRVSIDAGMTCPNVDGTVAVGGCVFCDNRSFSPSRRIPRRNVIQQLEEGIGQVGARFECERFLAYFQPGTNTYAEPQRLRELFETVAAHPQVVGVAIGTRPDCVPDEVLEVIEQLAARTYVSLEYGLQTIHDRTLDWMNRGHHHDAFVDAVERSRGRGFEIAAHVILGLPGESHAEMMATADEIRRLGIDSVKIHNLYVVRNTPLEDQWRRNEVMLMDRAAYVATVVHFLERLPGRCVIERLTGDAPPDFLVAPDWCLDKPAVLRAIHAELVERDTWQGKRVERSSDRDCLA
jgi:radical SAM protein (TIGR01212 family)